jgi:hypothetical protein
MLGCSPCRLHQPLDIGFTGIQRFATNEVLKRSERALHFSTDPVDADRSSRKKSAASPLNLTAQPLDHAVEEFDFPDPGLTLVPDLVPQHAVLAPQVLDVGTKAGDLGVCTCG